MIQHVPKVLLLCCIFLRGGEKNGGSTTIDYDIFQDKWRKLVV